MTKHELQKLLEQNHINFIKSKDKIICYPFSLKWKGKSFFITNNKKILFTTKEETIACEKFISFVKGA